MTHLILATFAGTVLGDAILVAWLAYRASLPLKIQPPSPPAKAAVFHVSHPLVRQTPQGVKHLTTVWADSEADAIEGLLLAAHGE